MKLKKRWEVTGIVNGLGHRKHVIPKILKVDAEAKFRQAYPKNDVVILSSKEVR